VYKAEDTTLKRAVALKFLPRETTGDLKARARFLHEAQAAAALTHSDICRIYEIDEAEGQTFIAMALIDGEDLRDRIAGGPLKMRDAIDITIQVAEGLAAAHENAIIHRDIKSANVMLTSTGQAKIMDFGLAKSRDQTVVTRSEAPALILPASGGAVRPSRSELCWSTVPGVDRYVVTVAPALGDEITRMARGNTATLDELEPGGEYVWRVTPDIEDWAGHGSWREFRVLEPEEEARLDAALVGMNDLEAGVLLLAMGIHDEAICRFDAAAASSDNSRSARLWRAQALADCGLYREAYENLLQVRGLD
ncbi:serine/threonine protein kinase, partial [bacterium]|nr:serine/threonine protein kinase [bacterium]